MMADKHATRRRIVGGEVHAKMRDGIFAPRESAFLQAVEEFELDFFLAVRLLNKLR